MILDLEPGVSNAIKTARDNYEAATSRLCIDSYQHMDFGKNFLKTCKISPDSVMQLSFQVSLMIERHKWNVTKANKEHQVTIIEEPEMTI